MGDPAKVFFRNPSYDGQLVRTLAAASADAADLGEVMAAARSVRSLDGASWHRAWTEAAQRAERTAERSHEAGENESERRAWLRASELHRQAYYFIRADLDDARLQASYRAHVDAFRSAARLLPTPAEEVRIPFGRAQLHGWLFTPDDAPRPRPTIVFPCGYDSTAEAGWVNVQPALARGYAALVFDGPGQGESLFVQRLFFRNDFEHVLAAALDWLSERPEVDTERIALVGRSFAGYLAPRAAAFERRLAALVCDPAQPDMGVRIPTGVVGALAPLLVRAQMRLRPDRAEFFGARMAAHGVHSVRAYFRELRTFTMLPDAASVRCPTLVVEADNDFAGGGGQTLADAVHAPVDLVRLTAAEGAEGHCAGLGQEVWGATVYGWLARTLGVGSMDAPDGPTRVAAGPEP